MTARCPHLEIEDSLCRACGACVHDVILNRACLRCGAVDPVVTVKPVARDVVPVDRLKKRD